MASLGSFGTAGTSQEVVGEGGPGGGAEAGFTAIEDSEDAG